MLFRSTGTADPQDLLHSTGRRPATTELASVSARVEGGQGNLFSCAAETALIDLPGGDVDGVPMLWER